MDSATSGRLPLRGHPLHTRSLTVALTAGQPGRWHARGDVIDLRKAGFVPMMSELQPAGIVHQMTIDLELDADTLAIVALETSQPHVAIEASPTSAFESCRDPIGNLDGLVGAAFDEGFHATLASVFGGPRGCSHLVTLLQTMASALPLARDFERELGASGEREPGEPVAWRSSFVDGVGGADEAIDLGVQVAEFHTRPRAVALGGIERLARCREARVAARVDRPGLTLAAPTGATRVRTLADLASAPWRDATPRLAFLEGVPVTRGVAGRAFAALDTAADRLLLDAVLQLAPGFIQVMAATMERWLPDAPRSLRPSEAQAPADGSAPAEASAPAFAGMGPPKDSCWMWRTGGPLDRRRSPTDD